MAVNFLLKRSTTASKRPTAAQLDIGELSLNYDAGTAGVFFEDSAGAVRKIGPAEVSATAPNASPAGSSGNSLGELWYDTAIGNLKIFDGTSFVDATTAGAAGGSDTQVQFNSTGSLAGSANFTFNGTTASIAGLSILGTSRFGLAATQDAIELLGRNGGTSSFRVALRPATLSANRTQDLQNLGGVVALDVNKLSFFAATTSAELAGVISDETGSGALVFATSPTLVTPALGVASATSVNKVTITAPATSATLTIANGKTLTASNTLTFTGTDASSVAFGTGGTVAYTSNKLSVFAATTSAELAGVISDETGSGALVFATSPTLVTPVLGVATGTSFNSITGLSSTNPAALGAVAVGTGTTTARADHVHPTTGLGLTSGTLAQFAATTSAQLAGVISDETGSGLLVFNTSPSLTTPAIGAATGTSLVLTGSSTSSSFIPTGSSVPTNGVYLPAANSVGISTNGAQRVTVDSVGRLLVNTPTSVNATDYLGLNRDQYFQVVTEFDTSGILLAGFRSNNTGVPNLVLQQANGSRATPTIVSGGRVLGVFQFNGYDGSNYVRAANITAAVDGTPGVNDMPGCLIFSTTPSGSGTPAERMRLDSSGRLGLGTSSPQQQLSVGSNLHLYSGAGNSNVTDTPTIRATSNLILNAGAGSDTYINFDRGRHVLLNVGAATGNVGIGTTGPSELLHVAGNARFGAADANVCSIELGQGATGNRAAFIDFTGDTTYTDFGLRISRDNLGANTNSGLTHRGTGDLRLYCQDAGRVTFHTSNLERACVDSSGRLGLGTSAPNTLLHVGAGDLTISNGGNIGDAGGAVNFGITALSTYSPMATVKGLLTNATGTELQGGLGFFTRPFGTAGQTLQRRMTIAQDGKVGIGTTSPSERLHVAGNARIGANDATDVVLEIGAGATGNRTVYIDITGDTTFLDYGLRIARNPGSGGGSALLNRGTGELKLNCTEAAPITFETANLERVRIDSSGRLLIGTSAPSNFVGTAFTANLQVQETANVLALGIERATNDTSGGSINFRKTRSTTAGGVTAVQDGDIITEFRFSGTDGTGAIQAAAIRVNVDGTPGTNDMPGRLVFLTTADGASSPTERMRIKNNGRVNINTGGNDVAVNTGTTDGLTIYETGTGSGVFQASNNNNAVAFFRRRSSDGTVIDFRRDTTVVGTITVTTTATAYNTSSDYRLKENVVPLTGAIDRLQQLPVHSFNFIADPDTVVDGFIAHEAQEVVPESVTGTKDEVDEDGNPVYQGIDQSKLVPLLTAALQEALARIEGLEQRLMDAGIA
jgi:hypothetical protein